MAGMVSITLASLAGAGVLAAVLFRLWWAAIALGVVSAFGMMIATPLIRRADPAELRARAQRNERWVDLWGRALGKASGGWDPGSRLRGREPLSDEGRSDASRVTHPETRPVERRMPRRD